ncbi:hypothetical protein HN615_02970 [Candidatus Woesearchaeota archaeon]|jgi:uncharacterized protein|nr:hypothetical protein [bacterium]MBT7555874.1 hypothetical protein [Candidatus Woesearchaeota archaeon]
MIDLIIVIVVFSFIQSIFGIGLLLFGTPTLLLFGYSYSETLWILLPCSIVISLIQTINNYNLIRVKKKVIYFTIPTMTLGLIFIVSYGHMLDINKIVGFFLLFIGVTNFSSKLQVYLQSFIVKKLRLYYAFIGLVHGISNMGGAPLSILMSTIYVDKVKVRVNIAFVYLILALFQLAVLIMFDGSGLRHVSITLMLIALSVYLITNRHTYYRFNNERYIFFINILILIYAVLAFLK